MTKEERESLMETNRRLNQELADLELKNKQKILERKIELAKVKAKYLDAQSKPKTPENKAVAARKEYLKKQYYEEAESCKAISTAVALGTFALLELICSSFEDGFIAAFLLLPLNGIIALGAYSITAAIIAHDGQLLMKAGVDVRDDVNACIEQSNAAVLAGIGVGIATVHKANQARKEISDPDHWTKV